MAADVSIISAVDSADVAVVAKLFGDYAASLDVSLDYQGFADEVATLPGDYAPPRGLLLLAREEQGEALGCVGCRPLADPGACEMKRLFVAPAGRGLGLGRMLVRRLIAEAGALGYREMRLDTLASMDAAQALYRAERFEPMAAYYDTPVPGTIFMRRPLV